MHAHKYELVLATDLDGTFLEGDHQVKHFFYNELLRLRENVMLIYTTGRPVKMVEEFCKNGYLPTPHLVVGDHGTHIVDGLNFIPIDHLQDPIIKKWNNGNSTLKNLLHAEKGIQLQPLDPPYRVAYYYDPDHIEGHTLQKITDAGFDFIMSCDMYLDIVPRGVNKGSSLLNILKHYGISNDLVITCGDSLNDLSLFQTGLKSIAVGNSETKLITAIQLLKNVYHSQSPGLLGILDGLRFYKKMHLFSLNSAA